MGSPRRPRSFLLVLILAAALSAPAVAAAQSSPFTPLPNAAPQQPVVTTATPATGTTDNGGLSTGDEIVIFLGGVLLLTAIVFFIWRDARHRAPLKAGETGHDEAPASTPHRKKSQARAKAKRAKASRRRNR